MVRFEGVSVGSEGNVSRAMVALAYLLALLATSVAQDKNPERRALVLLASQGIAMSQERTANMAAATLPDKMVGAFKVDPEAPIRRRRPLPIWD